jgi:hypothetical protein
VDQVLIDVEQCAGAMEWTSFKGQHDVVRGVEQL